MAIVKAYPFADFFAVSRPGAATRYDATGALVQAAPNAPRVDYDPGTLAVRGLLVEEAAGDNVSVINLARWLNVAAGTFVVEVMPGQASAADMRGILSVDDGTTGNRIALRLLAGSTDARVTVDIAGVQVAQAVQATGAALVRHAIRFSYGPAGLLLSVNGAAPAVAASALPGGLVRVLVGRAATAAQYLEGWLGPRFEYYPVQYTDTPAADGFTIRTR